MKAISTKVWIQGLSLMREPGACPVPTHMRSPL
jgi:hypothetical protein